MPWARGQEEATTPTAEVDPIQAALAATVPTAPTPQPNPRVEIDGELVEIPSEMLPELVRTAREKNISIEKAFLQARAE